MVLCTIPIRIKTERYLPVILKSREWQIVSAPILKDYTLATVNIEIKS